MPIDFIGFRPEVADKVRRLLIVLDRIAAHPFLRDRICLHGGTRPQPVLAERASAVS
jgi:hypothetical protein